VAIPAPLLLVLIGVWLACGLLVSIWPAGQWVWLAAGGGFAVLSGIDVAGARQRSRGLTVARTLPPILAVGRRHAYQVRVRSDRPIALTLMDVLPLGRPLMPVPAHVVLPSTARGVRLPLVAEPVMRGRHDAGTIVTRVAGPLRLWEWQARHAQSGAIRVFPDFSQAGGGALDAVDLRVPPVGARRAPRRGHGLEFKELRDYREGDALRLVDWKATARRGRPITREYEDQRDQQLLLVLDCGLRLRAHDGALSHFDHVLNAALRLAAVALAQGDAVGCATIAHDDPRLLLPRKSRATLQRLVQGLYDLQPGHRVPDYLADARMLHDRLRRHSLVVLLTALRDEDEDQLLAAAQLLRRRHRVTVASLREAVLDDLQADTAGSVDDAARWASTLEYVQARDGVIGRLRQRGVDVLDVPPRRLAQALSDHYWRLKRAGAM
jgi:uncharacterized protein (DUF58 family)